MLTIGLLLLLIYATLRVLVRTGPIDPHQPG